MSSQERIMSKFGKMTRNKFETELIILTISVNLRSVNSVPRDIPKIW
jgi:hypothetical protein